MADHDHERLAKQLEDESEALGRHTRELEDDIVATKADWERKRGDSKVPGANPPEEGEDDEPGEQETPPG